jgi:hypothetical protein
MLGISNKVICDSENEIKSCIRSFNDAKKWFDLLSESLSTTPFKKNKNE